MTIKWFFKKAKSLFSLKDKNPYPACQIYKGARAFNETYIGKSIRNVYIRWNEDDDIWKESEPAKHLKEILNHKFKWETLSMLLKTTYREIISKLLL